MFFIINICKFTAHSKKKPLVGKESILFSATKEAFRDRREVEEKMRCKANILDFFLHPAKKIDFFVHLFTLLGKTVYMMFVTKWNLHEVKIK